MDPIYIIDASGYLYRAYHAITSMTNSQGESTNALFGFVRSLTKLIKDFDPKNMVSVFDGPSSTKKRKEIYEDYKSHRTAMPEDLYAQIAWAQEFCKLAGIPYLSIPEVEADDTIGSIAKWAELDFDMVYLCTSDKDMAQLVNEKINLLNTYKDNLILGPAGVIQQFGVRPDQILDYLALTGDASDNIPGVAGFGAKTAASLLNEFDTLDNALKNIDKIPGKKGAMLKAEGEIALLSRRLALIDINVDFPKDPDFFALKTPDKESLIRFYQKMSFNSLIKEIQSTVTEKEEGLSYNIVDSEESFTALKEALKTAPDIVFHTLTTSEKPMHAHIIGVSFAIREKEGFYIPLNGHLGRVRALAMIKEIAKNHTFIGHNAKLSMIALKNEGIDAHFTFDTILASSILNSNERGHSIDSLAVKYFGINKTQQSLLTGKGKNEISMNDVLLPMAADYCAQEADFIYRLKNRFQKEIEERHLQHVYYDIELPLTNVLADIEMHGIYLDQNNLARTGNEVSLALSKVKERIFSLAGEEFNLNSPKQLSEILFVKLLIRPPKKTATGYSTNQEVLEELQEHYPIAKELLEWRSLEKMRSTYIDTLPSEIHPKTGRIHTTFNQFVAATGRLSSQDPNLQNIPARNPIGQLIRQAFKPEKEGWSFLSCDYSQIELRLLAHFSEDPVMIEAFLQGEDIHQTTAALIFGIPLELVTKEMRQLSKAVNFGVIYGQGAFGLSQSIKIELKEAKRFIDTYFTRFSKVKSYIEDSKETARKTGKATIFTGRERPLPEILNKNMQIRQLAERLAVNTPLQGGAADLIKLSMLKIHDQIKHFKGYMILQVHDELIFEVPDDEILEIQSIVKNTMEKIMPLKVPLIVNCKVGKNWQKC